MMVPKTVSGSECFRVLTDAVIASERHHLQALMARGVDGFIFVGSHAVAPPVAWTFGSCRHVYAPSAGPGALVRAG